MKTDILNIRLPPGMGAALRRAASLERRSVNSQVLTYFQRCLIADGHYPPTGSPAEDTRLARAERAVPPPARKAPAPRTLSLPAGLRLPGTSETTSDGVRLAATIAAIAIGYRAEQGRALGKSSHYLRELLTHFPDVVDLPTARAKGPAAWIAAGARPGLIAALFPGDRVAVEAAKKAQNRYQMDKQIAAGSEFSRFVAAKGIYGRGAVNLRKVLGHFRGMSPDEAVEQGADAWLAAGVSEDTARRLFGDEVGDEAKRLASQRANQQKRRKT